MRDFLLDTCIWSYWFDTNCPEHPAVKHRVDTLPKNRILWMSVITWGEIVYGHKVESLLELPIQAEYLRFIGSQGPMKFEVDMHAANKYGELRARLFNKYVAEKDRHKLRPEQIVNPVTSKALGIQENDLWIAAQAITRNLTLATNDKLARIREVTGSDLHVEDWTS
jgi:predicted nucleic acid-binding protein